VVGERILLPLLPALVALCGACAGGPQRDLDGPVALASGEPVAAEYAPALEALERAVLDGDDEVARSTLERLLARSPSGRSLELARAFERILDGRELVASLDLRLAAEELDGHVATYRLWLVAAHPHESELRFHPGAASLRESVLAVDPGGAESRAVSTLALEDLDTLVLPPGEELRVELATLRLPSPPGALALRARVELELLPGTIELEGRRLPARDARVERVEIVRLAAFLPTATVEPSELLRYVTSERVELPPLMERAVRIAPGRRAEALDLLAPEVEGLSLLTLGRMVPALRWLSGTTLPGGDPEAWRRWLRARAARRTGERRASALDIPAVPAGAPGRQGSR